MKALQKTFENASGNILVRKSPEQFGCGIVEMLHLYSKNESGCVIGRWEVRDVDGFPQAEFMSIHDRFPSTEYSFDVMEAVRFGQKLADLLVSLD